MQFTGMRPDVIQSIQHRWLLKCWSELRRDCPLPEWSKVDLHDIARSLDTVITFDVVGSGTAARFRVDFQGKRITEIYGDDYRGKFIDETLPATIRESTLALYQHATATAQPVYTIAEFRDAEDRVVHHERLLLPFAQGGNTVARILSSVEAVSPEGDFRQRGLLAAPPAPHYMLCATIEPHQF